MTVESYEVVSYGILLYAKDANPIANVSLFLKGTSKKVQIGIYKSGSTLPSNNATSATFFVYFPESRLASITDLLRNEKPVYFTYDDTTKLAYIQCNMEPTGEAE